MPDDELAALLVDVVRDWLRHTSDGWFRLEGLMVEGEAPENGAERAAWEQRVYAQLDMWERQARAESEERARG